MQHYLELYHVMVEVDALMSRDVLRNKFMFYHLKTRHKLPQLFM